MSANRYLPAAQNVAQAIPCILAEQGLDPLISRYVLTETEHGEAWLFVVMDDSVSEFLEEYASVSVLSIFLMHYMGIVCCSAIRMACAMPSSSAHQNISLR